LTLPASVPSEEKLLIRLPVGPNFFSRLLPVSVTQKLPLEVAAMFVKRRSHIYRRRYGAVPEVTRRFLEMMRQVHG